MHPEVKRFMSYQSLEAAVLDLERTGQLVRIPQEIDPYLEMAAIHRRVFAAKGPAILFERIKGSPFRAVSNLFGTLERSRFIFRDTIQMVQQLIRAKANPAELLKSPIAIAKLPFAAMYALPQRVYWPQSVLSLQTKISQLPQIQSWHRDGGAFILLPQVFSLTPGQAGIMQSNVGMYRVQLSGNQYIQDKEIGLHFQIHRGIGVHATRARERKELLKVSIFVGGPPAHTLSAVMPLPEGISELTFAGVLGGRRFRYFHRNGHVLSADADFVITGTVDLSQTKPEGPFGDHLGYYSLQHNFPVMQVESVYHRKNAIWPFTVVGRPPQEDTSFGLLIHELTGPAIPTEIHGLHEVNAVDAAGVHPLLLAIGSERYVPFQDVQRPQELLTIANNILGFGQLSLAKYLIISNKSDDSALHTHNIPDFFQHILARIDWKRDLHFYTNTTIDTLDYSGAGFNRGSKVVLAAVGKPIRNLATQLSQELRLPSGFSNPRVVAPGILGIQSSLSKPFLPEERTALYQYIATEIKELTNSLEAYPELINDFPLLVLCDDSTFLAKNFDNFLWITFTRSDPAADIYGVGECSYQKHWGCSGSLIIDARIKPFHAPALESLPEIEAKVDLLALPGKPLHNII